MHGTTPGEKWYGGLQFEAFGEGDKFGHGLKLGLRVSFCDHVGVLLLLGTGNQDDLSSVHTVLDCRDVLQLLEPVLAWRLANGRQHLLATRVQLKVGVERALAGKHGKRSPADKDTDKTPPLGAVAQCAPS